MTTTLPPPVLRTNQPFASPVALGATGGVRTTELLPIPERCACVPGDAECRRCFLDADHEFTRSQDV